MALLDFIDYEQSGIKLFLLTSTLWFSSRSFSLTFFTENSLTK